jgi:hypothetical protein
MKRILILLLLLVYSLTTFAQCSICTKSASQMGEEAGKGFNLGIVYLAAMPFAIIGYIAIRWYKNEKTKS